MEAGRVNSFASGLLVAATAWLAWRVYRFTIKPILFPSEPREYPYWIPVVGHLRAFFQNSSKLLTNARIYFQDNREPYALTVAGQTWYILTNGHDVNATFKINDGSFSYDIFAIEVMRMLGASEEGVKKSFEVDDTIDDKSAGKTLSVIFREYSRLQLFSGGHYDNILNPALQYISDHLMLSSILKRQVGQNTQTGTIDLYRFISETFVGFGQEVYFGTSLAKLEKDMISSFITFDTLAWQVLYQYPSFMCKEALAAKHEVVSGLERYFEQPLETRSDAAWMTLQLEKDIIARKVPKRDAAIIFFQLYWSACGNIRKAPFWMLSYIIFHPGLIDQVRTEVQPAMRASGSVDIDYLLTSCDLLNAIWEETLRITSFGASVRFLTQNVSIGGKMLRKNNRIMMPQRQLHFDHRVFGEDTEAFRPQRFLDNAKLKRSSSFRPFGGGATLCPGRHLAKSTSLAFVALLLHRFDITPEPVHQGFPIATEGTPSIGLVDVEKGSDLRVRLTERPQNL